MPALSNIPPREVLLIRAGASLANTQLAFSQLAAQQTTCLIVIASLFTLLRNKKDLEYLVLKSGEIMVIEVCEFREDHALEQRSPTRQTVNLGRTFGNNRSGTFSMDQTKIHRPNLSQGECCAGHFGHWKFAPEATSITLQLWTVTS